MAMWELLAPRRALSVSKTLRWTRNLGIVVLDSPVLRAVFPVAAVGIAVVVAKHGWGLLNVVDLPFALAVVIAIVALDLATTPLTNDTCTPLAPGRLHLFAVGESVPPVNEGARPRFRAAPARELRSPALWQAPLAESLRRRCAPG